ncbi:MAG: N-acetyltransferase [Candidatus Dormibacteraeota bacterium]|nr:N-acetyltransferase [Candidatus Dormibacteraeota bacterium]
MSIYNHYVEHSHATFDEAPVTVDDRREWFQTFAETGPHQLLVADNGEGVLGCATSGSYRSHSAFRQTVETGIYLHPDAIGQGLGRRLYDELLLRVSATDVHVVLAGVALPNPASVALHLSCGFKEVGTFTEYALKRGRRISSTWFELRLTTRARPDTQQ